MIKHVYSVYDNKCEFHKFTFAQRTKGEAIRTFTDLANDANTEICKHPEDFSLFFIADFDETKGEYKNVTPPEHLGLALEFKKQNG